MAGVLAAGDRVLTPGGLGSVVYVRMAPPGYSEPAAFSVLLDAKRDTVDGYAGTIYPADKVDALGRRRTLQCCCCGEGAPAYRQWFNRDTGYGLCGGCATMMQGRRDYNAADFRSCYGDPGVHWIPVS